LKLKSILATEFTSTTSQFNNKIFIELTTTLSSVESYTQSQAHQHMAVDKVALLKHGLGLQQLHHTHTQQQHTAEHLTNISSVTLSTFIASQQS